MNEVLKMANEKIAITDNLRLNIVERRKKIGISSYELSEMIGNGHSKFWLQNIENGKTKKITKSDLIKIYMILQKTDDPDDVIDTIEQLLKQNIGKNIREWYELIDISPESSEIYDEDELMDILDELLENGLNTKIRNTIFGMSTNQKQAALTVLQHFYYSLYKNPDLAYTLLSIPVYGVNDSNNSEHITALNDILSLYTKFNSLAEKNNSIDLIHKWQKHDEYFHSLAIESINTALENLKELISILYQEIHKQSPNFYPIVRQFTTDVSFMIERGQPNVLKHYLKSWQIYNGKEFALHIENCIKWFLEFQDEYDLPFIFDEIDQNQVKEIYEYLNNYGDIEVSPQYID